MPSCKYGALKKPVGRRRCKKAPRGKARRRVPSVAPAFLNGIFGRRRRRGRR